MSASLTNKVAIVTGGARGIGRAIVETLVADGAKVVVNYGHSKEAADELIRHIEQNGGQALAVRADVGKVADLRTLFQATIERFGRIDILVNNAGVMTTRPIGQITEEIFDREYATNVKSVYFACQLAAQFMAEGGHIVNFSSSILGLMVPTYSLYAGTKGAVEQITRQLAKEFGPKRITVNVIAPGPINTPLFTNGKSEEQIEFFKHQIAFGRLGETDDVAKVVRFLASDDASWITGQTLRTNGGFS